MTIPNCDGRECYNREPHQANLLVIDGNKRWRDLCYVATESLRRRGVRYRVKGSFGPTRTADAKEVANDESQCV